MYGYESWTIKKAEHWRIDAFTLRCWRRLLRVFWLARRSNWSTLKEINSQCSLEGLTLKLQHLATWCKEPAHWKRPNAGKDWGQEEKRVTEVEMTGWTWVWANARRWWKTGKLGMLQSMELQRVRHNWVTEQEQANTSIVLMRNLRPKGESVFLWWQLAQLTRGTPYFQGTEMQVVRCYSGEVQAALHGHSGCSITSIAPSISICSRKWRRHRPEEFTGQFSPCLGQHSSFSFWCLHLLEGLLKPRLLGPILSFSSNWPGDPEFLTSSQRMLMLVWGPHFENSVPGESVNLRYWFLGRVWNTASDWAAEN